MAQLSLENRLIQFLNNYPGSESIDSLSSQNKFSHRRRADYFLNGRRIILELKSIKKDMSHKVEAEIEKHRERNEFPLFYGEAELSKILAHLPDGDQIHRHIYEAITKSIEKSVRSAEEQITHTRQDYKLSNAVGILLLINESVDILNPEIVAHRVSQLMRRTRTGKNNSEKFNYALLFFESHILSGSTKNNTIIPYIEINNTSQDQFPWIDDFFKEFYEMWAKFNGGKFLADEITMFKPGMFTPSKAILNQDPVQITRQESWQREYVSNPYLSNLNDEQLLAHGSKIIKEIMPHYLKGGTEYNLDRVITLLKEFTHFNVETNNLGLDLRKMPKP